MDEKREKWWQIRLSSVFISMALFGAALATVKFVLALAATCSRSTHYPTPIATTSVSQNSHELRSEAGAWATLEGFLSRRALSAGDAACPF
jgi:hypothetical protein